MSLLKNAKLTSKNYIIFVHQNNEYYQYINNDNKLNIFNKDLMNIFLDQFEETIGKVTYDDIVAISVLENRDIVIINLPKKLKYLFIMSSMCRSLELNNEVCLNIEHINIDKSNISHFPDISQCIKLKTCNINHSAIDNLHLPYELPNSLVMLNLQGNLIKNDRFSYDKLLNKIENKTIYKVNLSDNYLKYDEFPEKLRVKCNLIRQNTYIHTPIVYENVANTNINYFIQNQINTNDQSSLFSSQNVHLSSINQSVINSVNAIKEFINIHNIYPISIQVNAHHYIPSVISILNSDQELFNYYYTNNKISNSSIDDLFKLSTTHTITKLTCKSTFELIWSILCFKYRKNELNLNDIIDRLDSELIDGSKMCFTGKYNRLINSMVGIIEGVQVGFSKGEELQLEFGKLLKRFNDKNNVSYTFDKLICEAKELLQFEPTKVKQVWMDAVNDLNPDPEFMIYNGSRYLKTWDYDVLDIESKELIGYYMENPEKIVYLSELI